VELQVGIGLGLVGGDEDDGERAAAVGRRLGLVLVLRDLLGAVRAGADRAGLDEDRLRPNRDADPARRLRALIVDPGLGAAACYRHQSQSE
jgi:hypothetical protein